MFLSILFAHALTACTRMPAGEIDRGTIDVLFGMPLSRANVYLSESAIWLGGGAVVVLMGLAGSVIGHSLVPPESRPEAGRLAWVLLNLFALYASVGAFTLCVSAMSDRRGKAIGVTFGVVLAHLVWNFLGQYWSVAERLSFLSVLNYFKPMPVLSDGTVPVVNLAVLGALALALWGLGAVVFIRRDIHTV
jgi:putative exporter of polyketide antibiotics